METRGICILVADDEAALRALAQSMLERLGFRALLAEDGRKAIQLFEARQHEIGCVILDYSMPRMNGDAACQKIQEIRKGTPVILLSGFSERQILERGLKGNYVGFIQKPYTRADLAALLGQLFDCQAT